MWYAPSLTDEELVDALAHHSSNYTQGHVDELVRRFCETKDIALPNLEIKRLAVAGRGLITADAYEVINHRHG